MQWTFANLGLKYLDAQLDIFGNAVDPGSSFGSPTSVSTAAPSHSSTSSPASGCRI